MAVAVDWVFFCEDVAVGDSGEVTSIIRIVRPHTGFGRRPLPLTMKPYFVAALRGTPGEAVTCTITVSDQMSPPKGRDLRFNFPRTGIAEVAVPLGTLTLIEPGVTEFGLIVNGDTVFTIKAPLEHQI